MKKVGNHKSFSRIFFSLALTLSLSLVSYSQDAAMADAPVAEVTTATGGDAAKGKELFNANCAACHKLDAKST
uniref:c-type cytochrome n=1 Tax=uncultured Flavobacterium sp. TaxID=165435 RepID=UPI0030EBC8B7